MSEIRTVTLELIRHGPSHNQLLSPLTKYLGICGNYGTASVSVPYEHKEFMSRLSMLRYQSMNDARSIKYRNEVIEKTAKEMSNIFSSIPGLVSEINQGPDGDNVLTHLRLVLSASELSMLPFELSKVPVGCKGGNNHWLSLQTHAPVCITRQIRGVESYCSGWNKKPRILFIFAASTDMNNLVQAHTDALYKAMRPWIKHVSDKNDPEAIREAISKHITILANASIDDIEAECSQNDYTHVHILAHGGIVQDQEGETFGLRLCKRKKSIQDDAFETVCGSQLAQALGSIRASCPGSSLSDGVTHPLVVTVASCDSANVGDIVYHGASLAHELHHSGIPFVVASQFPLSFSGSVTMAEVLYQKLICGVDPRWALHSLRSKLYTAKKGAHDWASLVAYAALPDDIDYRMVEYRYVQAKEAIDVALSHLDDVTDSTDIKESNFSEIKSRMKWAVDRLPRNYGFQMESAGLEGAVNKRMAQTLFRAGDYKQSLSALHESRRNYYEAMCETLKETNASPRKKRAPHWTLTQYISLNLVLEGNFLEGAWQAALLSSEIDEKYATDDFKMWANWSTMELYLLRAATTEDEAHRKNYEEKASNIIKTLSREMKRTDFSLYSTQRQLNRYIEWWGSEQFIKDLPTKHQDFLLNAKAVAEILRSNLPL